MAPMRIGHAILVVGAIVFLAAFFYFAHGANSDPTAKTIESVKVAAIQCPSRLGDIEYNRRHLTTLIERAAQMGARIVVLPETAITGYLSQDLKRNWHLAGRPIDDAFTGVDPRPVAETVPGESTRHFCALADRLDLYLTIPLLEAETEGADTRLFNTVCIAAPDGRLVAHYRKLTPWPHPEQSWATPGDRGVQFFDTEFGRVGLAICFDIHTILEQYREHDLWALLYPIAWVDDTHPVRWFRQLLPKRVKKFGHHVIGANWSVEREQSWTGYGYSTIFSGAGEILAQAESRIGDEIVLAELKTR